MTIGIDLTNIDYKIENGVIKITPDPTLLENAETNTDIIQIFNIISVKDTNDKSFANTPIK